jgi:hypothetical protein
MCITFLAAGHPSVISSHVASGENKFHLGLSGNAQPVGFCAAAKPGQLQKFGRFIGVK